MNGKMLLLAPLRGVTIRAFRDVFAGAMRDCGFTGAVAPFIPANPGIRFSERLFSDILPREGVCGGELPLVPQVISKDPHSLREWCRMVKDLGFSKADLNGGCPFPMIRKKGRGSGLLRTPDVLERMLEAGCDEMGPGGFSFKTRLGIDDAGELRKIVPVVNRYPLGFVTIHARTARQMYDGSPDKERFEEARSMLEVPVVYNGDADVRDAAENPVMVGRRFIRELAGRADARELLARYIEVSRSELCGDAPVLGRLKELLSYWCLEPDWKRLWPSVKICRNVPELMMACRLNPA